MKINKKLTKNTFLIVDCVPWMDLCTHTISPRASLKNIIYMAAINNKKEMIWKKNCRHFWKKNCVFVIWQETFSVIKKILPATIANLYYHLKKPTMLRRTKIFLRFLRFWKPAEKTKLPPNQIFFYFVGHHVSKKIIIIIKTNFFKI